MNETAPSFWMILLPVAGILGGPGAGGVSPLVSSMGGALLVVEPGVSVPLASGWGFSGNRAAKDLRSASASLCAPRSVAFLAACSRNDWSFAKSSSAPDGWLGGGFVSLPVWLVPPGAAWPLESPTASVK
jgi:hypothetical protein